MSHQPLDPETVIDPFTIASFTGPDTLTGVYLDADQINSSVLIKTNNTPAVYIDKFQNFGINTLSPNSQLDINSSSGDCVQLTYNGSDTNKANLGVSSDGKLLLSTGGAEVSVDNNSSFNVKGHNGTTKGLMLNNSLVRASADQLNYTVVTPGTASNSKAIVLNSSGSISGINALSATSLTGTLQTASQPNIESVTTLNVTGHNGTIGLSLGGTTVTSTADELNYVDVTPGSAASQKALVLDSSRNISNINSLSASELTGTLQTASQPNITSVGTLNALDLAGPLTGLNELSVGTTESGRTLVINNDVGNCFRMYYDADTNTDNYADLLVNSAGHLLLTSAGGNVDITTHDGSSVGLKLGGVLVTASADQINYLQGTTTGSAAAGKALIVDSNRNIANINSLTASTLTGTIQTSSQPNIASVNALDITTHNGSSVGLKLNGTLVTSTAVELNYVDTTQGSAEASKALVVDENKDISGINSLSADELTGTLQTSSQPNVTSVGTLDSLAVAGDVTVGSTVISESDIAKIDGITNGQASENKALVVDDSLNISGINSLSADELTGTLQTTFQPNLESVEILDITQHDGSTEGLSLGGTLVTSTATELNYVDTTPGSAQATKALVVDSNKDIDSIRNLSAINLTGTLQTASQPNLTSVSTLDIVDHDGSTQGLKLGGVLLTATADQINSIFGTGSGSGAGTFGDLNVTGSLALTNADGSSEGLVLGSTLVTASGDEINYLDGSTPGTVVEGKAVVVDNNKDISSFRNLTATNLTGTIQTADQPNITSLGTLNSLSINSSFTVDGVNITSTEAGRIDNITAGVAAGNKALVLDSNKSATGIGSLSLNQLTLAATVYDYTISSFSTVTSGPNLNNSSDRALAAYSPTLGVTIYAGHQSSGSTDARQYIMYTNTATGFLVEIKIQSMANSGSQSGPFGLVWNPTLSKFIIYFVTSPASGSQQQMRYVTSSDGLTWDATSTQVGLDVYQGTNVIYHAASGHWVFAAGNNFYYSANGTTWSTVSLSTSIPSSYTVQMDSIVAIGNYITVNFNMLSRPIIAWNGTSWSQASTLNINSLARVAYHQIEDRLYGIPTNGNTGSTAASVTLYYIDDVSTRSPSTWTSNIQSTSVTLNPYGGLNGISQPILLLYIPNYEIILVTNKSRNSDITNYDNSFQFMQFKNKSLITTFTDGPTENPGTIYRNYNPPIAFVGANNALIIPATGTNATVRMTYFTPNGSSNGIVFGSTTITESEFMTIDGVVLGTAGSSKALVVDGSKNISGIGTLGATTINATTMSGTIQTASQPNITSVGTLTSISTSGNLTMGSTTISQSEIGVLDNVTPGTSSASKALIVDSSRNITNINALTASELTGTIQTAAQPNITSVGTLTSVSTSGDLTMGTTTISESEIGVLDGVTAGTASASKALIVDSSRDITNINALTASELTGTLQTSAQPNITSVGTLDSLEVAGDITVGSTVISETDIAKLDDITNGTASASKALVVDANRDITNINALTASELTGTLQTSAQPNITSVGTLDSLEVAGDITVGSTVISETDIAKLDNITNGTASASKALVVDSNKDIGSIRNLSATNLTGTLQTASQPNITSVNTLDIANHDGSTQGLSLDGILLTATASQLNDIVNGSYSPDFIDSSISGDLTLSGHNGSSHGLILGTTLVTATAQELNYLDGSTPGSASAGTAVVLDQYGNSSGINSLSTSSITTSDILCFSTIANESETNSTSTTTGSIVTAGGVGIAQDVYIGGSINVAQDSAISTLDIVNHDGSTQGLKLGGVLLTATAEQINSIFGAGGEGTFTNLVVNDTLTLSSADGSSKGLVLGEILVTASGTEINYLDGSTPGTVVAGKAVVVDSNKDISSFRNLTATNLTGTLQTASQPNITSVGTLTGLTSSGAISITSTTQSTSTSTGALRVTGGVGIGGNAHVGGSISINGDLECNGNLVVGGTIISESEIVHLDGATPGTAEALKAMITDSDNSIQSINVLGANTVNANESTLTVLDVSGHNGSTQGLSLGGTLLTATASQLNDIVNGSYSPVFVDSTVSGDLTLSGHNGSSHGLILGSTLVTATAQELNYLDGSTPGSASAGTAVVLDQYGNSTGINSLSLTAVNSTTVYTLGQIKADYNQNSTSTTTGSIVTTGGVGIALDVYVGGSVNITGSLTADELTGTLQTSSQPNITSVTTLDITGHDGSEVGLSLGGTLLTATASQLNDIVNGNYSPEFVSAEVTGDLTVSGHNGSTVGLVLGSTLVTATGTELNYLDGSTPGTVVAGKAVVVDSNKDISSFRNLTATNLTGTLQTASQPNVTSVTTLDITGHDASTAGLSLNGVLITASATELNYVDTTAGSAQASKALVLDTSRNIDNINSLTAANLTGTIQTAAQPNITSVGTLTSLTTSGDLTVGETVISETDIAKIDSITNGTASAGKALVIDSSKNISGIGAIAAATLAIGSPANTDLPIEIGYTSYQFTGSYAYSNNSNAHGLAEAGTGDIANYSLRTDGRILCTGEIQLTSDRRMKENIIELAPDLAKKFVMTTTPVKFNWKSSDGVIDYGYIAQDVMKAGFNDLVMITPQIGMEEIIEEDGFVNPKDAKFTLSPGKIVPLLALNQREVFDQLEAKDQKIQELESRLEKLEQMLSKMG